MPATAEPDVVDAREAERLLVRAVAAAAGFVLAASLGVVLSRSDGEGGDPAPVEVLPGGTPVLGGPGPTPGEDVAAYVARRHAALRRVEGRLVAVVSFAGYRTGAVVAGVLDGVAGVRVRALLVAAPGGAPSVAEGSLGQWADRERRAAEAERAALERVLLTTEDPDFVRQYHDDIARLTALLDGLDAGGDVVFGAVVQGDAGALRRLARRGGMRLVDPVAQRLPAGPLTVLAGLRPEETVEAGTPPTRPLPPATRST